MSRCQAARLARWAKRPDFQQPLLRLRMRPGVNLCFITWGPDHYAVDIVVNSATFRLPRAYKRKAIYTEAAARRRVFALLKLAFDRLLLAVQNTQRAGARMENSMEAR